jgi:hypothetical protein
MEGIFPYLCVGKTPHIDFYSYLCTRYDTAKNNRR